jgi:hypothetical protein
MKRSHQEIFMKETNQNGEQALTWTGESQPQNSLEASTSGSTNIATNLQLWTNMAADKAIIDS